MIPDTVLDPAELSRATPPRVRRRETQDVEPLMLFVGGATAVVCLGFVAAGIAWPAAADALLRLLLATLAVGFCATRALLTILPMRVTEERHTPFDRFATSWSPPAAPRPLRNLTSEVKRADDEQASRRSVIPASVRRRVRDEGACRLAERHGLELDDPDHHARIRALVSPPTWRLIRSADAAEENRVRSSADEPPTLSQLGAILDDLERL